MVNYRTDPAFLDVKHEPRSLVEHDGGHPVYSGAQLCKVEFHEIAS
jgi:hypothetical protein